MTKTGKSYDLKIDNSEINFNVYNGLKEPYDIALDMGVFEGTYEEFSNFQINKIFEQFKSSKVSTEIIPFYFGKISEMTHDNSIISKTGNFPLSDIFELPNNALVTSVDCRFEWISYNDTKIIDNYLNFYLLYNKDFQPQLYYEMWINKGSTKFYDIKTDTTIDYNGDIDIYGDIYLTYFEI